MWNRFSIQCSLGAVITVICILFVFVLTGLITPRIVYGDWDSYVQRYAIIVMGGNEPSSGQLYRWYWGDTGGMFHELISYGFTGDNIYFLSYGDSANAHPEWVDAVSSTENIRTAFQWAQAHCTANDLLYIYRVDHGSPTYFNSNNGVITHAELGTLMQPIVAKIIIGAYNPCYSGAVIDDISREGVITITSQDASHPNSWGWAGMWRRALRGAPEDSIDMNGDGYISMTEAYNWICPLSHAAGEHSMFDDNGDRVGHECGQSGYNPDSLGQDGYKGKLYSLDAYCDLPDGTPVCGDVYGVWDSAGSPYYVCGDIAVPIGQQLIIEPGVEVLFMGHYKFNVYGLLKARGTEQDSIVFTHYYPSEDSTWWGIRFNNANNACTLRCCVIEYGNANGSGYDSDGGGIFCYNSNPIITHCTIRHNKAFGFGGGVCCLNSNGKIDTCLIVWNSGAGIYFYGNSDLLVTNCTISDNDPCGIECPASEFPDWHMIAKNTIVYWNSPGSVNCPCNSFSATYSDIQDDPCDGEGVIDCDPEFQDYYRLSWGSCCIDAGDPNSPKDPDSTRADIGVFYFSQCRTWVVKPDGSGDVSTIQDAIDSASNCDTILLTNGTFWGNGNRDITFRGKPIIVRSQNGAIACTLDCSPAPVVDDMDIPHRGFFFHSQEGPGAVLDGVTIINGRTVQYARGGGILCVDASPTIKNCKILGNAATDGGGIACYDSASPTITQCTIAGNRAYGGNGGGIYCSNNSSPTIVSCTISGNKANSGGGIYHQDSHPYLTRTIVWSNCAASAAQGNEWYCDGGTRHYCCSDVAPGGFAGWCGLGSCPAESSSIYVDPMFCHPMSCDSAPTIQGNYCLQVSSPCLPDSQPTCGLIGALGVGTLAGDCNGDGTMNAVDIVYLINYLYCGGPAPVPLEAGDVNCDGKKDAADVVYLINYLYLNGPPPCCYCPQ
jgi:parallel beta-helix repeat protein